MALRGKMQGYAAARANGLDPRSAAAAAGYETAGVAVTTSRLESRADVRAEIKRLSTARVGKRGAPDVDPDDPESPWEMKDKYGDPLSLMLDLMNNPKAPKGLRYQAAKDALPYCHPRKEAGKKDEVAKKAKDAAKGKFQQQAAPSKRLVN